MDRYLINGFGEMVKEEPFFSTVITFSPHGNYGPDTPVYLAHPEAQRIAKNQEGFFPNAVAGAMETDLFVGALMEKLEESGHLEDTVVVFYTDHYNYYLQNDALIMEMKGVDNMNLIRHTEFFIYAQGQEPMDVEKVTGSVDVLPTLANLFGLDTQGAFLVGHDALGDQGGYVFFEDGSWYDGETYWDSSSHDDGNPPPGRDRPAHQLEQRPAPGGLLRRPDRGMRAPGPQEEKTRKKPPLSLVIGAVL